MKKSAYLVTAICALSVVPALAAQHAMGRTWAPHQQSAGWANASQTKAPSVKIGVRVCDVPGALAAHIGREGLMISNIVTGGPADLAGIQRYDVIVSFAGRPIDSMQDLLTAIQDTGARNEVDVTLIRQSQEVTVQVTPLLPEEIDDTEWKYEEPTLAQVPSSLKYYGHVVQADPKGGVVVEPLGQMHDLPRDIQLFIDRGMDLNDMLPDDPGFNVLDLNLDNIIDLSTLPTDLDAIADAEITVETTINENGEIVTIHKSADGAFEVKRTDADGNEETTLYENAEQFEQGDADADELYERHTGQGFGGTIWRMPQTSQLPQLQRDYQVQLRKQLDELRARLQDDMRDAQRAVDAAQSIRMRIDRPIGSRFGRDVYSTQKTVVLNVDDEGHISLAIRDNDDEKTYEFDSREEFQKQEPELYQKYEELIDEAKSGACIERFEFATA